MKKNILILLTFLFFTQVSEAQWYIQQSGTTNPLYDIEFINDKTGWCCGDGGYIIKTTNGGTNWTRQSNGVPFVPLFGIHPVDSNIAYAVGLYRTLIKTTNGGEKWFSQDSGTIGDGTYISIFFLNESTGWIGNFGDPDYGVKKTTDGGNTLNLYPTGAAEDLYFKDSLNGIGVMGSALVLKTTNGGLFWSYRQLAGSGNFYKVSFIDNYIGYTASHRAVYKTSNFGDSWDSVGNIPAKIYSISFSTESIGYAGSAYSILKTSDGGVTWSEQVSTGVVYNITTTNDSLIWTCGNGGRIWHSENGGISIISNQSFANPDKFELYQNYPNPFNSSTNVKFKISKSGEYKLEIFNVIGQKIKDIFNQKFNIGVYEVNVNAEDLSSGMYFYKLKGEKLDQTKKFLLIK